MKKIPLFLFVLSFAIPVFAQKHLYVLSRKDHTIYSVNIDEEKVSEKQEVLKNREAISPHDLISLPSKQLIYWVDPTMKTINVFDNSGTESIDLTRQFGTPIDIDIDHQSEKIYWLEHEEKVIYRSNWDGEKVEKYIEDSLKIPSSIALHVSGERIYWADLALKKIFSRGLNGGSIKVELEDNISFPVRLAIDEINNMLYWSDDIEQKIFRLDLMSREVEEIFAGSQREYPYALYVEPVDKKLYWTDYGLKNVRRCNLDGSELEVIMSDVGEPLGLTVVNVSPDNEMLEVPLSIKNQKLALTIFPNPADDEIHISTTDYLGDEKIIQLFNTAGQKIKELKITSAAVRISIPDLPSGRYFCRLSKDNQTMHETFVITNR